MLRHVKKLRVSFAPFDAKSKSVREFLRQIKTNKIKATNPKAKINVVVREDYGTNQVDVEFLNGHKMNLVTCDMIAPEIFEELEFVSAEQDE